MNRGGDIVKVNNKMLDLVLAKKRLSLSFLRKGGVSPQTITKVRKGEDVLPATIGKIAAALCVDVTEIVEQEAHPHTAAPCGVGCFNQPSRGTVCSIPS